MLGLGKLGSACSSTKEAAGKFWQSAKVPVEDTNIKGHNLGNGLKAADAKLDGFIAKYGVKASAEAGEEAAKAGSKTILGRLAGSAKWILNGTGKVARGIPVLGTALTFFSDKDKLVNSAKEGKLIGQVVQTSSKAAGAALGAAKGAAIGAPFGGWGAIPGAIIGGLIGAFVGDGVGYLAKEGIGLVAKTGHALVGGYGNKNSNVYNQAVAYNPYGTPGAIPENMSDEQLQRFIMQQLAQMQAMDRAYGSNPFMGMESMRQSYRQ